MKPHKPRIVKKRLTWKWNQAAGCWDPYHRATWHENGKRRERAIKLDWGANRERLDALYWECEAGLHEKQAPPKPKETWRALIEAWRSDPRVQRKLADGTKKSYRRPMDDILVKNGDKAVRATTRQALRAAHDKLADTPRKADRYLQTVSLLWNYGRDKLDWRLSDNPAAGIEHFGKQSERQPWPEWMIEKASEAPAPIKTTVELILGTGQRPNAAITMRRDDFRGETMFVLDEKSDEKFEVYCPDELRQYVEALPHAGEFILAKNLREPLGYDAIEKRFRAWRASLGEAAKPFSLHGLRKNAINRLAEAGWTDAEIQAATNQSAEMVTYYRKKANRVMLTRNARERQK